VAHSASGFPNFADIERAERLSIAEVGRSTSVASAEPTLAGTMSRGLLMLVSVDPSSNRFRFVALSVEPQGAGARLIIRWGWVGTAGRSEAQLFASLADAEAERARLFALRARRGYVLADERVLGRVRRALGAHRAARCAPRQFAFPAAVGF
jgi:predicted DNA-binding WGR domain protein